MKIRWLSLAEQDLNDALDYYLNFKDSPKAASDFYDEIETSLGSISEAPLAYPKFEGDLRVKVIPGFPYSILYLAEESEIIIETIIQQEREPGYWGKRLKK
jgi:plasmid stabilization system protein ParE